MCYTWSKAYLVCIVSERSQIGGNALLARAATILCQHGLGTLFVSIQLSIHANGAYTSTLHAHAHAYK